jgi:TolB-like protein
LAIAAPAAAAAIGLGLWVHHVRTRPSPATRIRSLAVLPLENLSPEPGQDYVADGITEELITNLAQSLPLRVISRTSVMRYKQTSEPIARIARELGADAIVEGSAARSGNRVTVTVQLIDAAADRHLWARRYERSFGELPDVEAGLSQEIASQVGGELIARQQVAASQYRKPIGRSTISACWDAITGTRGRRTTLESRSNTSSRPSSATRIMPPPGRGSQMRT